MGQERENSIRLALWGICFQTEQIGTVRRFWHFQHPIDLLPEAGRQLLRDPGKNLLFGAPAERLQ